VDRIESLIAGKVEDYRDFYTAGYALWVYLTRYRKDTCGKAVDAYLASFSSRKKIDERKRFATHFADGEEGRWPDLTDLLADFARFLGEAASVEKPEWRKQWEAEAAGVWKDLREAQSAGEIGIPLVRRAVGERNLDPKDRPKDRTRSREPALGEGHASRLGDWFAANGDEAGASEAWLWALEVEEPDADLCGRAAEACRASGRAEAAWLLDLERRRLDPPGAPLPSGEPDGRLKTARDAVGELTGLLAKLEETYAGSSRPRAARAMRADRADLARAAGFPEPDDVAIEAGAGLEAPDCPPARSLLTYPLREDVWHPLRTKIDGLWFADGTDELVLGREKRGKAATGLLQDARVRRQFVLVDEPFAGSYTVRFTVKMVSAFVEGGVVVGHTRDDRGVQVMFQAGDLAYAIGKSEERRPVGGVSLWAHDERRSYLGPRGRHVIFPTPRESFELAVHVHGPFLRVDVNGEEAIGFRSIRPGPIEGRIGFLLESGFLALGNPEVRRHRPLGGDLRCPCGLGDLPIRFDEPCAVPLDAAYGRRVTRTPAGPYGTFLLLYTRGGKEGWANARVAKQLADGWVEQLGRETGIRSLCIAYPAGKPPTAPWGGLLPKERLLPHQGLPGIRSAIEELAEYFGDRSGEEAAAEWRDRAAAMPPFVYLDTEGVIRMMDTSSTGLLTGNAAYYIQLLRGY
jgi:hypothetical protein